MGALGQVWAGGARTGVGLTSTLCLHWALVGRGPSLPCGRSLPVGAPHSSGSASPGHPPSLVAAAQTSLVPVSLPDSQAVPRGCSGGERRPTPSRPVWLGLRCPPPRWRVGGPVCRLVLTLDPLTPEVRRGFSPPRSHVCAHVGVERGRRRGPCRVRWRPRSGTWDLAAASSPRVAAPRAGTGPGGRTP